MFRKAKQFASMTPATQIHHYSLHAAWENSNAPLS
jgi:hypothetical protein